MYTKAFSTLGCPQLTLPEVLALATRHHVPAVELRALAGTLDLPAYFASSYGSPAALAQAVSGQPVRIVALDTSLRLAGGTAAERGNFLAFLPWAEALGVKWLRVFDGGHDDGEPSIAAAAAALHWWEERRAANGWRADVMVETHDSLFHPASIARFRELAPGAHLLWDAFNTWHRGERDLRTMWESIRTAVVHVHVKDSVSRPILHYPYTYVLPGDGEFPIGDLLPLLKRDGFDGVVSLEWERQWHPYLPPIEEALTAAERRNWW